MKRLLVIPAAGRGTRLGSDVPKLLHPVDGRPMVDHLLDLHAPFVESVLLVVAPDFEGEVADHLARSGRRADLAVQAAPNGMLPAILLAERAVREVEPDRVWITWCDQVAIHPLTLRRLTEVEREERAALVFPTCTRTAPYIHFPRDSYGRIGGVLHAREGDEMPEVGESDVGLFSLSRRTFLEDLAAFLADEAGEETGEETGERNFLPFIPWLASKGRAVLTFPVRDDMESVGVNTPEDLRRVERYLRDR